MGSLPWRAIGRSDDPPVVPRLLAAKDSQHWVGQTEVGHSERCARYFTAATRREVTESDQYRAIEQLGLPHYCLGTRRGMAH